MEVILKSHYDVSKNDSRLMHHESLVDVCVLDSMHLHSMDEECKSLEINTKEAYHKGRCLRESHAVIKNY